VFLALLPASHVDHKSHDGCGLVGRLLKGVPGEVNGVRYDEDNGVSECEFVCQNVVCILWLIFAVIFWGQHGFMSERRIIGDVPYRAQHD